MTSYIQLLKKIEDFCDAHYQIQRYGGEFREQMPNLSTESEKYPIVFVTPTSGVPMYDTNQISLDIYCVDIIQKDRENLNTIVSDCHLILTDLYGYFSQGDDLSVDVIGQPSQTPLNNLDLDYVAGWMMTIVFEVDGYCVDAIPMSPITPGSGECEDASYTVEYADGTLIESGTIPSGGSKTVTVPDCPTCDSATWTLKDTDGNILNTGTIASGGSADITAPDATAVLKDSAGTTLNTTTILSGGTDDITAPDASVTINGDGSFPDIKSGGSENIVVENTDGTPVGSYDGGSSSWVLPDSQINVNGVDEGDVVSVKAINVNLEDGSGGTVTPDAVSLVGNDLTIDVTVGGSPAGATLMPSGQTTVFRTGDDADKRLVNGRTPDFFTINYTNPFGSNARFTDELGGSTYTNNIVIDWSTYDNVAGTVLGWRRTQNGVDINWNDAIDGALAVSIGTFTTGWRLPNAHEIQLLYCWNIAALNNNSSPFSYAPFYATLVNTVTFWTSTTLPAATNQAMRTSSGHRMDYVPKTTVAPMRYIPCRTFTVTGTTLT